MSEVENIPSEDTPVAELPTEDQEGSPASEAPAQDTGDESALGDAGKKALDRMKAERNAEKAARREVEKQLKALQSELESLKNGGEDEVAKAKREAREEALKEANERLIRSELKAAAIGKLADPSDVLEFIRDLSGFEVDENGNADAEAISDAIADLLERKPHLAAKQPRFRGTADGGARGKEKPSQLTRDDLKHMTPEEIDAAFKAGRLSDLTAK